MAKYAEATVISTAGSTDKCVHIKKLGADYVFNYQTDDVESEVLEITDGQGVDRMVDVAFGTNVGNAHKLIKANGTLTAYSSDGCPTPSLPFLEFMYKNIAIKPFSIYGMPETAKTKAFEYIGKMLEKDALEHLIGTEYSFDKMIDAHQAIESKKLFGCCLVNSLASS